MENSYHSSMKEKIPIEITWMENQDGVLEPEIILNAEDYFDFETSIADALIKFKKDYTKLIKKARKIIPKDKSKRKSSHFWQVGKLLYDFNKSIENEFEIINYSVAVVRDFQLYNRSLVAHLIQFAELFKKKDISDEISMSIYLELIRKASLLKEKGRLEKEKKRLLERSKNKTLPTHKEYRVYLHKLTKDESV